MKLKESSAKFAESLECNILVTVDGGSREECSATGWTVGLCFKLADGTWRYRIVMVHGTVIKERVTSFVAELAALKEAITYVTDSLTSEGTSSPGQLSDTVVNLDLDRSQTPETLGDNKNVS